MSALANAPVRGALRIGTAAALLIGPHVLPPPVAAEAQTPDAPGWCTIAPAGATGCGFGEPFVFWVREGDPRRVLIYLQGGGACWDHESCDPEGRIQFDSAVDSIDHRQRRSGIFDRSEPANPFREYTAVFVPYCTGDFHLGNRRVIHHPPDGSDTESIAVAHVGSRNVQAVLDHLKGRSVTPRTVIVAGASAGAVASPIVAARIAGMFPGAAVRQIGDGAAGLRAPETRALLAGWGVDSVLAAWGMPLPSAGDAFVGMYRVAAAREPRVRFTQVSTREDARIAAGLALFGYEPGSVAARVRETYRDLMAAGLDFTGYVLPGTQHTILWRPDLFTARVDGELLIERLERDVLGLDRERDGS